MITSLPDLEPSRSRGRLRSRGRATAWWLASTAAGVLALATPLFAQDQVELISVNADGSKTGNDASNGVALNADGRFVLFGSSATDMATVPDTNNRRDFFVRNRETASTALVTVNKDGSATGAPGADFDGEGAYAVLTPDGRFVAFACDFTDLVPEPKGTFRSDVFLRDMQTGTTRLVSINRAGTAAGLGSSYRPDVSNDGRFVSFLSTATDMSANKTVGSVDAFVRDLQAGSAELVSVNSAGTGAANRDVSGVRISPNGRYVLFGTTATNIVSNDTNGLEPDVYLRDRETGTTSLISINSAGTGSGNGPSAVLRVGRVFSADSRYVLFASSATNLVAGETTGSGSSLFVRDLQTGTTRRVLSPDPTAAPRGADMSADGRYVVFDSDRDQFNNNRNIYRWDMQTGTNVLVTPGTTTGESSNGVSFQPYISADGRIVTFTSSASNLVPNDTENTFDAFARDMESGTTRRLNHTPSGGSSSGQVSQGGLGHRPISDDGKVIGFVSTATDLVSTTDTNGQTDVFVSVPASAPKFLNISTRMRVETGDNALIAGFIITGSQSKKVIIRGMGPSLASQGVGDPLQDPTLELNTSEGAVITNDNWKSDQQAEIEASTIAPADDREAAIVATLPPGAHTAIVRGRSDTTGVGLAEVYDLDSGSPSQLANISTRGLVQTGDNAMIGGFIIGGGAPARVLLRAIGPSLPVSAALQDPTLELVDGNGNRTFNDNWRETQEAEIVATTAAPERDEESAIVTTLVPGAYTAVVRGKDDTIGVALVEGYNLK